MQGEISKNIEKIKSIKCFLLDMDGTFYLGDNIIKGGLEFIERVQKTGRDYRFLTNNTSHNADFYLERLKKMGLLTIEKEKILTAGQATANFIFENYPNKTAFVLGNDSFIQELEKGGVSVNNNSNSPDLVIVGFDTTLNYKKLVKTCDLIRAGLPYIASHPDFNCPTQTGFIPDIGSIMLFIEGSTNRKADVIMGKPYKGIVDYALAKIGLKASELAIVGDRLYTDIKTGVDWGIKSILVMSGETTPQMVKDSSIKPSLCFESLADITPLL